MGDSSSSEMGKKVSDSNLMEAIGIVMAVVIIILCLAVLVGYFIHLYAKVFLYSRHSATVNSAEALSHQRRFDSGGGNQETGVGVATIHCQGLEPSVLKALPIVVFRGKDFEDGIECAVCLCGICEGERARFLPNCYHGFHMECIDMWFQSHATCPLCRKLVSRNSGQKQNQESNSTMEDELRIEVEDNVRMFPTNVLLYGNESEISIFGQLADVNHCVSSQFPSASVTTSASSSTTRPTMRPEGVLAIDIPVQVNEEDTKSPVTHTPRMRSFMRLWSKDMRVNPSSTTHDVEQEG